MADPEQRLAWEEIQRSLRCFRAADPKPQFVMIPELSVPRGRLRDLRQVAMGLGAVVVAGVDYRLDTKNGRKLARNEAMVIIPDRWKKGRRSRRYSEIIVGKTYPAMEEEKQLLDPTKGGWTFVRQPHLWIFDAGEAGRFGVSICYDFMDLERALMYKEQVQHLFVLAYNRDAESFRHLAEALARTMYCNVIICNTGFYGGSLAVSPYYKPWQRTVYRYNGYNRLTSQVIELPLRELIKAQRGELRAKVFKSVPPGWEQAGGKEVLKKRKVKLK